MQIIWSCVFIQPLSLSRAIFNTFILCSLHFLRWDPEASRLQKGHCFSQNCWRQFSQKLLSHETQQRTKGTLNTSPHTEHDGSSSMSKSSSIFNIDTSGTEGRLSRLKWIKIPLHYTALHAPDAWPLELTYGCKRYRHGLYRKPCEICTMCIIQCDLTELRSALGFVVGLRILMVDLPPNIEEFCERNEC